MRSLFLALVLAIVAVPPARADVVDSCDHVWERGMNGHGMSCETNWPVVGVGGLGFVMCGGVLVALLMFAARPTSAGRTRGD